VEQAVYASESLKANTRQGTLETVERHDRDRTSGVGRLAGVVAGNDCGMAWVNPQIGRRPGVSAYNLANVLDTSRITTVACYALLNRRICRRAE